MYLSREVSTKSYYSHYLQKNRDYIACTGTNDISLHNNQVYVRDNYSLIFIGKFTGDLKQFKKFAPKNLKDNI